MKRAYLQVVSAAWAVLPPASTLDSCHNLRIRLPVLCISNKMVWLLDVVGRFVNILLSATQGIRVEGGNAVHDAKNSSVMGVAETASIVSDPGQHSPSHFIRLALQVLQPDKWAHLLANKVVESRRKSLAYQHDF